MRKVINSISTNTIECIVGRTEIIQLLDDDILDTKNLVLISISEPVFEHYSDEALSDSYAKMFKRSLRCKFWDVEDKIGNYDVLDDELAKEIQNFILQNINEKFCVHCRAGKSRSAGVGMAIECIKCFGVGDEAKYNYLTSFNSEIKRNPRYTPNMTVFDKLVKEY